MSVHGTEISLISRPGTKLRSSQNPRHTLPKENISSANRNSFIPVQVMYASAGLYICAACVRCEMAPRKQYVIIISSDMSDGEIVSSSVKSLPGARACVWLQSEARGRDPARVIIRPRLIRPRTARNTHHITVTILFSTFPKL